tara:strand:- start:70 stop:465 length:396 start_codon:yes stop_codon:yes gene_type:complete
MVAKDLWLKRKHVMDYEDSQTEQKSQLDQYKNYILSNDSLVKEIIEEHNALANTFEIEVEEATKHLQDKLQDIKERKLQINTYYRYILSNDKLLSELTKDYNVTRESWKSAITKYTIGLDEFVASGEVKDV